MSTNHLSRVLCWCAMVSHHGKTDTADGEQLGGMTSLSQAVHRLRPVTDGDFNSGAALQ